MRHFHFRIIHCGWLVAFLLLAPLAPLAFTACDEEVKEGVDITLASDVSGVVAAINDAGSSLTEKLSLIESTLAGLSDSQAAFELVRKAVESLGGTMAEKLASIEAAIQSQTTSLGTKIAVIEAAVQNGFADVATQQELVRQAVESLGGTTEEKLAAIEAAVAAQTMSLETKLGLVEAAVTSGFADTQAARELIKQAVESLGGTMEEKLAAIETALSGQTTDLSAKLALIETALKEGFAEGKTQQELLEKALESLTGTVEEKLAALEKVMKSQTSSLETKLDAIETAAEKGLADASAKLGLIQQAVASLADAKFDAIQAAISSQTTSLETKLAAIEAAFNNGAGSAAAKLDLIKQAIESSGSTTEQKLQALQMMVSGLATNLSTKLDAIQSAVTDSLAREVQAIVLLQGAVQTLQSQLGTTDTNLCNKIGEVVSVLDAIQVTLTTSEIATVLADILSAIQGLTDYSSILSAIETAVEALDFRVNGLAYLGASSITVVSGGEFTAVLSVKPTTATLTQAMLRIDCISSDRFFAPGVTAAPNDNSFTIKSLEKDPSTEGQYLVTVTAAGIAGLWEEAKLAFVATDSGRTVSSEAFQAIMMPKASQGLKGWCFPGATFYLFKSVEALEHYSGGGHYEGLASMSSNYYALDSREFKTSDNSKTRSYTADYIESVKFLPVNDSVAPVFVALEKDKRYILFTPDTAGTTYTDYWPDAEDPFGGRRLWRNFRDSSGMKHETLQGKLVLTDHWNNQDTIKGFTMSWYNSTWYPETSARLSISQEIASDGTARLNLKTMFSKLGLESEWLKGIRYELEEQYVSRGSKKMSAKLDTEDMSLAVRLLDPYDAGDKFSIYSVVDLYVYPSETNPDHKELLERFSYDLVVTIIN